MKTLFFVLLLALPFAAEAQPKLATQQEAMRRLEFLIGTWEGEGWMQLGPGARVEFLGNEHVESMLDGSILKVKGTHFSKKDPSGKPVHDAFGIFSYNEPAGNYDFRAFLATGMNGSYSGHFENDAFIWGFEIAQGTVRYTVRLTEAGEWHEIGEFSPKGTTMWYQNFEMKLHKVADGTK
ncbi:MAG: hypothetical protein O3B41_08250 [Bacteroidetes bacterium]|nr:hypothetical protein [Bacteroidota bacterium]